MSNAIRTAGAPPQPETNEVHYLKYGKTPCPMAAEHGAPFNWPKGHTWSQLWKDVTCEECLKDKPAEGGA